MELLELLSHGTAAVAQDGVCFRRSLLTALLASAGRAVQAINSLGKLVVWLIILADVITGT